MAVIIGERKTLFWFGEKFTFERVRAGEWVIVDGNHRGLIPSAIIDQVELWDKMICDRPESV